MKTHEIYEDQIRAQVVIGKVIEDVRHNSPTQGHQFVIMDNTEGVVTIQELDYEEYVIQNLVFSQIV